jgi:ADP-ribose pyrophosphatase
VAVGSGHFEQLDERELHRGRVIRLVQASFRGPGGEPFERDVVRSPGAVAVVPVLEGPDGPEVIVVRQFRPAIGQWLLEIPAGLRDKPGEDPEETARRELAEEAGYAAERYELLTVFANAAGMTDQRTHIYLATGLTDVPTGADGVEETYLTIERVAFRDVPELIRAGALADAKTLIGLLLAGQQLGV